MAEPDVKKAAEGANILVFVLPHQVHPMHTHVVVVGITTHASIFIVCVPNMWITEGGD